MSTPTELTPEVLRDLLEENHRKGQKLWLRSQRATFRSWRGKPVLIACLFLAGLMIVLTGCNPMTVTQRFPDGSPSAVTEWTGGHVDIDSVTQSSRACAPLGEWICPWAAPPSKHFWTLPVYHVYVGYQGEGYWQTWTGAWDNYYNCQWWPYYVCDDGVTVTGIRG